MTAHVNDDDGWKRERNRRELRRLAQREQQQKRLAARALADRAVKDALPRRDDEPLPRID